MHWYEASEAVTQPRFTQYHWCRVRQARQYSPALLHAGVGKMHGINGGTLYKKVFRRVKNKVFFREVITVLEKRLL